MTATGFQLQRLLQDLKRERLYPTQPRVPPVRWSFHLPGPRRREGPTTPLPKYDLVVAAYVLGELRDDKARQRLLEDLWGRTGEVLVLIEPGTPVGTERILAARQQVVGVLRVGC